MIPAKLLAWQIGVILLFPICSYKTALFESIPNYLMLFAWATGFPFSAGIDQRIALGLPGQ